MPGRPPRRCTSPYCPNPALKRGRCQACEAARDERYQRIGETIYNTVRWRNLRRRILDERPICARRGCRARSTDVDHVIAIADGGQPWAEDNLEALCHACHATKTAREVGLGHAQPAKARARRRGR